MTDNSTTQDQDLFASPSVKFGLITGLALIVATLVLISAVKHQHLQVIFPGWVFLCLGGLALLGLWLLGRRDKQRPRAFHRVLAALFFVVGVMMAAPMITLVVNGAGLANDQSQNFVARAGRLEPTGSQAGIAIIDFPGPHNRYSLLKDGTTLNLAIKKGRLGLWEYDDTPVRQAADEQKIPK